MFEVRNTKTFPRYLDLFCKWCHKKGYLVETYRDGKKDVKMNLVQFIRNPNETRVDIISRYLLSHYHKEMSQSLNEGGKLVQKYVKKGIQVPQYIFSFEEFWKELQFLLR